MPRVYKLVELNPKWRTYDGRDGIADALQFDCPEDRSQPDHAGCVHIIPITPALDGTTRPSPQRNGAVWDRRGDDFSTLTLTPSIRCSGSCRWHGFVTNGEISFCGDSQAGPDWRKE